MGIVGVIVGGGLAIVGSIVGGGISIWQTQKAERRMKEAEARAEKQAQMAGKRSIVKAMRQAAAGATLLRIQKSVMEDKLKVMQEGGEKTRYQIAKDTEKNVKEDVTDYDYGKVEKKLAS